MKRCYKCGIIFREDDNPPPTSERLHCSDCPVNFVSTWGKKKRTDPCINRIPIGCTDGYLRDYPPRTGPLTAEELA